MIHPPLTHEDTTYESPHPTYVDLIAEDSINSTYQTEPSQTIDAKASAMYIMAQIILRENTAAGTTAMGSVALSPLVDMPILWDLGAAFRSVFLSAIKGIESHAEKRAQREILEHDIHVKLPPLDEWTAKARVAAIEDMKPFKVKRERADD